MSKTYLKMSKTYLKMSKTYLKTSKNNKKCRKKKNVETINDNFEKVTGKVEFIWLLLTAPRRGMVLTTGVRFGWPCTFG
jgi:hypothetical protein